MRKTAVIAIALDIALGSLALGSLTVFAEEVSLSAGGANTAPVQTPARGMTMGKVEAAFGVPTQRVAAVGQPPITRWEYPGFVVYFEHQHVIHSVVR